MEILSIDTKRFLKQGRVWFTEDIAKRTVKQGKIAENDIVINDHSLKESDYFKKYKEPVDVIDFIRGCAGLSRQTTTYYVSTKRNPETGEYDIYEINIPPNKVAKEFDNLYYNIIWDVKNSIPGQEKGRTLSFKKLGLDKYFNEDCVNKLKEVVMKESDPLKRAFLYEEAGLINYDDAFTFLNTFHCDIWADALIDKEKFEDVLSSMASTKLSVYQNNEKLYQVAKDNRQIFYDMSHSNYLLYGEPSKWIHEEAIKIKMKTKENTNGLQQKTA